MQCTSIYLQIGQYPISKVIHQIVNILLLGDSPMISLGSACRGQSDQKSDVKRRMLDSP